MIKCILFDFGYTLIYNVKHEVYTEVLKQAGKDNTLEEVSDAFLKADRHYMHYFPSLLMQLPICYLPAYITTVNYYLGLFEPIMPFVKQYHTAMMMADPMWKVYDETRYTLSFLKDQGLKIGLVTNWGKDCRKVLTSVDLQNYFDALIISDEIGIEKPDRRIFDIAVAKLGVTVHEALMIGDNYYDDGIGATNAGMDYAIIDRSGTADLSHCRTIKSLKDIPELLSLRDML